VHVRARGRIVHGVSELPDFEVVGDRAIYRPTGTASFEQAVELVAVALQRAREGGVRTVLVNVKGLVGMTPPGIFARHAMARRWVEAAGPHLCVAMVTRPEMIDPEKIGVLMAQNRGGVGDVFDQEADAIAFLDSRRNRGG
jgi:hypothetical protein